MWRSVIKDDIIYITDGTEDIRIGHTRFNNNHPLAVQEANRRNNDPNTVNFLLTPEITNAFLYYGTQKITFLLHRHEIKIPYQEAKSMAAYAIAKAQAHFRPNPNNTIYTYYTKILYNTIGEITNKVYRPDYNLIMSKPSYPTIHNIQIKDAHIIASNYTTIKSDEDQKGQKYQPIVLLNILNQREKKIVIDTYWHDKTLKEIGIDIGLTRERVRQLLGRALNRLREHLGEQTIPITTEERRGIKCESFKPKVKNQTVLRSTIIKVLTDAGGTLSKKDVISKAQNINKKNTATYQKILDQLSIEGIVIYTKLRNINTLLIERTYTLNHN